MSEVSIQVQETTENVEIVAQNNVIEVNITRQSGGGGGAVDSVNGQTGVVVLDADDISETATRFWLTTALKTAYDSALAWISANGANLLNHLTNTSNPHNTTATQVDALQRNGSNANSDVDLGAFSLNAKSFHAKGTNGSGHLGLRHQSANPTATGQETVIFAGSDGEPRYKNDGNAIEQLASQTFVNSGLATKENTITAGTTAQYWRGDKTFQTLDKTAVGLSNVDNTSDLNKPISSAVQTALDGKITQNTWVDISLTSTITGFSSFTTRQIQYFIIGNQCTLVSNLIGTSNSGLLEFNLPFNIGGRGCVSISARTQSLGVVQNTPGFILITANSNLVQVFLNASQASFANSGTKSAQFTVTFSL